MIPDRVLIFISVCLMVWISYYLIGAWFVIDATMCHYMNILSYECISIFLILQMLPPLIIIYELINTT